MKILFVCTGNSCRSVMAEAYLRKRLEESGKSGIEVYSAGVAPVPGMMATQETKQVIIENGGSIRDHCARKITKLDIQEADLIFVMEKRHRDYMVSRHPEAAKKTYLLRDFKEVGNFKVSQDPNIRDPIGRNIDFYREVFLVIKESVERILENI